MKRNIKCLVIIEVRERMSGKEGSKTKQGIGMEKEKKQSS